MADLQVQKKPDLDAFRDTPHRVSDFFAKTADNHKFDIKAYWKEDAPGKKYQRLVLLNEKGEIFDYRLVAYKKRGEAKIDWENELKDPKNWLAEKQWKGSFGDGFAFGEGAGLAAKEEKASLIVAEEHKKTGLRMVKRPKKARAVVQGNIREKFDSELADREINEWVKRQVETDLRELQKRNKQYSPMIEKICNKFSIAAGVRPLVYAIMDTESEGDPKATHTKGKLPSFGLMQITDIAIDDYQKSTKKMITNKFDPEQNLAVGIWFFKKRCLDAFPGDATGAVLAYNKGGRGASDFFAAGEVYKRDFDWGLEYASRVLGMHKVWEDLGEKKPDKEWVEQYLKEHEGKPYLQ